MSPPSRLHCQNLRFLFPLMISVYLFLYLILLPESESLSVHPLLLPLFLSVHFHWQLLLPHSCRIRQVQPVVKEVLVKHFVLDESEIQDTEKPMKLLCRETREKEVQEYFGTHGNYKTKEAGYISVTVPQISGPQFFGWLTAMGRDVTIVKPKKTAAAYRDYLKLLAKEYKGI